MVSFMPHNIQVTKLYDHPPLSTSYKTPFPLSPSPVPHSRITLDFTCLRISNMLLHYNNANIIINIIAFVSFRGYGLMA